MGKKKAPDKLMIDENAYAESLYNDLIASCSKHVKVNDIELIRKAFDLAKESHKGVKRKSGEPYIIHPLAVAKIVTSEIGLGAISIACALLHDVVEDTDYMLDDIRHLFGDKIASIIDGLTKIAGVKQKT